MALSRINPIAPRRSAKSRSNSTLNTYANSRAPRTLYLHYSLKSDGAHPICRLSAIYVYGRNIARPAGQGNPSYRRNDRTGRRRRRGSAGALPLLRRNRLISRQLRFGRKNYLAGSVYHLRQGPALIAPRLFRPRGRFAVNLLETRSFSCPHQSRKIVRKCVANLSRLGAKGAVLR